jgi:acetyl esterase
LIQLLGLFVPQIPYLGNLVAWVGQQILFWLFVGTLLALLAGIWVVRRGRRRAGVTVAGMSALGLAGLLVVAIQLGAAAGAAGVSYNPLASARILPVLLGGQPDETITYLTDDKGLDLQMDYYAPATQSAGPAPAIVYVHGGGWITGFRTLQAQNLRWFADHGYAVFTLDYTLADGGSPTWDIAPAQVACGLGWVAQHAADYDIDRLGMFGDSAGGNLAINAAYQVNAGTTDSACGGDIPAVDAVGTVVPVAEPENFWNNDDAMQGAEAKNMVSTYLGGLPAEHPDRVRAVTSATFITPKAPPTFAVLAGSDHLVPIDGAQSFLEQARAAGIDASSIEVPYADHIMMLFTDSPSNLIMRSTLLNFFDEHLAA